VAWKKKTKFGNIKTKLITKFGLVSFSSRLEANTYLELEKREKLGYITNLKLQDRLYLGPERFQYTPDFKCLDLMTNEEFWVEAKGMECPTWRRNYRLWKNGKGPGRLEIYKGNPPKIVEVLIPKSDVCKLCGK